MKAVLESLYNNPKYAKAFEWSKLITITGGAQIIVQAIGIASGILIIRLLPTQEYALYTIANTMLGTMTLLADGGISTGVMAEGGKVWKDREKLGAVLITGLELRKKFAVGSIIIVSPILLYLLIHHNASPKVAVFILLSLIPSFLASLSGTLFQIIPRLHQQIIFLQKVQLENNILRLILSVGFIFWLPFASIAIIAAGIPQFWTNYQVKKFTGSKVDWTQEAQTSVKANILKLVRRILPGAVYYSFLSQVTVWLISMFGTTAAVAQIGALGRIAVIMTIFTSIFNTLVTPRFARLNGNSKLLLKRFFQIQFISLLLGFITIGLTYLYSSVLLAVLGKAYAGLKTELVLTMVGSYLSVLSGTSYSLCANRGWVLNPVVSSTISALSITAGIQIFDIATLSGVASLNVFSSAIHFILFTAYGSHQIRKI